MKKLAPFTTILVHPGSSHNDEIIASMLAMGSAEKPVRIFRRNPTEDDLQNQEVLVLDQGGKVDNWGNVFDHHQRGRDEPAECTFTLLAKELGVDADLGAFFPWYRTWAEIDAHGPFQWAKQQGIEWTKASPLLSPVDDLVHDWWEEDKGHGEVDPALVWRLYVQGRKLLETAAKFKDFCERADHWSHPEFNGVKVLDFTSADANEALDFGGTYAKSKGIAGGIIVSRDNRGPGLALFRREDDPRVDFSVLDGNEAVTFAHKGGFIAKTREGVEWAPLVKAAIKA